MLVVTKGSYVLLKRLVRVVLKGWKDSVLVFDQSSVGIEEFFQIVLILDLMAIHGRVRAGYFEYVARLPPEHLLDA